MILFNSYADIQITSAADLRTRPVLFIIKLVDGIPPGQEKTTKTKIKKNPVLNKFQFAFRFIAEAMSGRERIAIIGSRATHRADGTPTANM